MVGVSCCPVLGTLQTLRSPSAVCVASISVFCFDDEPCQARQVILDGALEVVRVCNIVKAGCSVATSIEPLRYLQELARCDPTISRRTHPIANVLQSVAGAIAVMGSNIVLVEMCSDVEGSKSVIEP